MSTSAISAQMTMGPVSILRCIFVGLVVANFATITRAQPPAKVWDGTSGDWTVSSKWSPSGPPGLGDTAHINSGTVTLSTAVTLDLLSLTGGSLTGTGSLTIASTGSTWSGGNMNGAGSL